MQYTCKDCEFYLKFLKRCGMFIYVPSEDLDVSSEDLDVCEDFKLRENFKGD